MCVLVVCGGEGARREREFSCVVDFPIKRIFVPPLSLPLHSFSLSVTEKKREDRKLPIITHNLIKPQKFSSNQKILNFFEDNELQNDRFQ